MVERNVFCLSGPVTFLHGGGSLATLGIRKISTTTGHVIPLELF
jgi:hypothetical protein